MLITSVKIFFRSQNGEQTINKAEKSNQRETNDFGESQNIDEIRNILQ